MKLLIDISDEEYEFIKNLQSVVIGGRGNTKTIQYNVINAIKNGIPYESAVSMPIKEDSHKAYWDSVGNGGVSYLHQDSITKSDTQI